MIIFVFFSNEVGGCRVLKGLIAVFMCEKSRYGETLNKNTHSKTYTNLTLLLN